MRPKSTNELNIQIYSIKTQYKETTMVLSKTFEGEQYLYDFFEQEIVDSLNYSNRKKDFCEIFNIALQYGFPVNYNSIKTKNNPLLVYAVQFGKHHEGVREILKAGADPNIICAKSSRNSLIHIAVRKNPDIFNEVLKGGADINAINANHETALGIACNNYIDCGRNSQYKYLANIMLLLYYGADTTIDTSWSQRSIHFSSGKEAYKTLENLFSDYKTKRKQCIQSLINVLSCQVKLNPCSQPEKSIFNDQISNMSREEQLYYYFSHRLVKLVTDPKCFKYTLDIALKSGYQINNNYRSGKNLLCDISKITDRYFDYAEIIKILLAAGADINSPTRSGNSALHLVTKYSLGTNDVDLLLQNGADVNSLNKKKESPLDLALARVANTNPTSYNTRNLAFTQQRFRTLLRHGAKLNYYTKYHTPRTDAALKLFAIDLIKNEEVKQDNTKQSTMYDYEL